MRQSLIISTLTVLLLASMQLAPAQASEAQDPPTPEEIKKIYADYSKKRDAFFASVISKKNARDKVADVIEEMAVAYEKCVALEVKVQDDFLTVEGNEMGWDIEMFKPLSILADSLKTARDCKDARDEYERNYPIVGDETGAGIQKIINQICN